jgi:DNA-binding SARP family transcriptional activator/predicted ATPase
MDLLGTDDEHAGRLDQREVVRALAGQTVSQGVSAQGGQALKADRPLDVRAPERLREGAGGGDMKTLEPAARLGIMALGPPQVLRGDAPVTFTRHKTLALLVYLAVSGRMQTRDALASLLTDAATDAEARAQFRVTLTELRAQVGDYLVVTRTTVGLAHDQPLWLDVAELEAAARDGAPRSDPARLAQAVTLYRGAFLAGLTVSRAPEFEAWLLGERERLRALLVSLLSRLLEHSSAQGDLAAALGWACRLLDEEPGHEATHLQLMRLLARSGQREAALAQYELCRRALAEEAGTVPAAETIALYEQLRGADRAPPTNLPAAQAGFMGREAELALVAERLADPACRLLTLLGLGGSGKTSLALCAAAAEARPAALAEEHPFTDGVYLVDLAALTLPRTRSTGRAQVAMRRLATAIGRVLGLEFRGADPVAHLAAWLRGRAVLLVLDNMEQLLDGVALLTALLEGAPRLKLLVTSRERLHLPEEWVLEVGGLPLPAGPDDLERAAASSLYLQQMRKARASEPLDEADRAAIVRICVLTQGLPLALVLAARWTPSLPTAAIAQELAGGMDLLAAPGPRVPERQRSMRDILHATWGRLNKEERTAMQRLAVFRAGFTRAAVEAVAGVALPLLLLLGEYGLIGRDPAGERYTMHDFVHQYAAEQLAGHAEEERETRRRHAAFYAALVQQVTPTLRQTVAAQEVIGADRANIRAAWDWAVERADTGILEQMLEGVTTWHRLQGLLTQAAEVLEQAAERLRAVLAQATTPDPAIEGVLIIVLVQEAVVLVVLASYERACSLLEEARARARAAASLRLDGLVAYGFGRLLVRQCEWPGALRWTQQAVALARAAQAPTLEADALTQLGVAAVVTGDYVRARGYLEPAVALYRTQHDRLGEVDALHFLGHMAREQGDFGEAQCLYEQVLQLTGALGWRGSIDLAQFNLGVIYDESAGRHVEAETLIAQDLHIARQTGAVMHEVLALAALGRNALYQGDLERAGTLLARARSLSREVTSRDSAAGALRGQSLLAHYQGDDQRARRCAQEALEIARTAGLRREERQVLRLLGHALVGLGELPAAMAAYREVANLDEELGLHYLRVETATDLARIALAQRDTAQAYQRLAAILPELEQDSVAGLEEPVLAYLTCYRVLRSAGDPRAHAVLAAGHAFLQERAAQFVDEKRRSQYLGNLPAHRDLLTAWRAHGGRTVKHLRIVRPGAN